MRDDNVRPMWSDNELDAALAALRSDVDTSGDALSDVRAELMAAAGSPTEQGNKMTTTTQAQAPAEQERDRRPRWGRWAVSAAAVAAVAAGAVLVPTIGFGDNPPAANAAAEQLNAAADEVTTADQPLADGQYRYRGTHFRASWHLQDLSKPPAPGDELVLLNEGYYETWEPGTKDEDWLVRDTVSTGDYEWITGSDEEAAEQGQELPEATTYEKHAKCGRLSVIDVETDQCAEPGTWEDPTPEFIASLPTDPQQLYEKLVADHEGQGDGKLEIPILESVGQGLNTGLYPADVRANIYRAIALIPGLEVTEGAANLDGRAGTAFGVSNGEEQRDLIIDPATGEYIGERQIDVDGDPGVEPGTVVAYSSVVIGDVDEPGEKPAG